MGETEDLSTTATHEPATAKTPFKRRAITWLAVIGVFAIAYLVMAAIIPRWWSQRVADATDGSITASWLLGLAIGFGCTFVPLLILSLGWRFRSGVNRALLFVVLAALAAAPNLATLSIVVGTTNTAHDSERTFSVFAPGFRTATAIGALAAVAAFVGLALLVRSRNANKRKRKELEGKLAEN